MKKLKGTPGFVAFVVVCLCGMYLATGLRGGEPQAAAAPAQSFDDSGVYEPGAPVDDGYNRLLVDVPAEPEARTVSSTSEFLTEEGVDLGVLDGQDDSAVIENVDGELVATYPDGSSIVLTADETDEGPGIDAIIAELEADPEVVEVRKIDDQTIAVTTTRDAEEIGTMVGLTVNPDEPTQAFETDPYFAYQWGLENTGQDSGYVDDADVDAPDAWATSSRGSGIVVAVLDSGVDFGHPDLGSRRWTNTDENCGNGVDDDANGYVDDCHGWDFMFNDASPWDGNNNFHGTHVAGIIAASNDNVGVVGMAANATIMDVRILDAQGRGYTSAFAAGIRYAVDNGADVINMSVGTNPGVPREYLAPVEAAVQYARANGVVIVAAAGNSNVDVDTQYVWPASFGRYYDNVATIAATDYADSRSSFSNYGAQTVVLGAPGSRILSATLGNNWSYASGTSMAAPMFAGAVALLYGDGLAGSPAEAIEQLVASADPVPSLDGRARNAGRLNVGALYSATPIDPVRVEATGLHSLNAGSDIDASLNIRVNDVEGFAAQEFRWEARLLTAVEGQAHGVLEHPVSVNGVDTLTNGQALFALSGNTSLITDPSTATEGSRIDLGTKLPAGSYALIVEAVAADDPTMILAPPSMLFFDVAPAPEVPDTTTPATDGPTTTTEAGVTTTTIAASPTTIAGSPSTTIEDDDRGDDRDDRGREDRDRGRRGNRPPGITPSSTIPDIPPPARDRVPDRFRDGWDWTPTTSTTTTVPTTDGPTTTVPPTDGPTSTTQAGATSSTSVATTVPGNTTTTVFGSPSTTSVSTTTPGSSTTSVVPTTALATTSSTTGPTTTTTQPNRNGVWEITAVAPNSAPVGVSGGYAGITGMFPSTPRVFFGSVEVTPTVASRSYLLVPIPVATQPGAVDISLRIDSSIVLLMEDAFTYTGSAITTTTVAGSDPGDAPGGGDTPGTTTPSSTPDGQPGTPGDGGDGVTTTTQAGTTPTTVGNSPTTTVVGGPTPTTVLGDSPTTTVVDGPTPTTEPGTPGTTQPGTPGPGDTTTTTIRSGPNPSTPTTVAPAPSGKRGLRPTYGFGASFVTADGLTVAPVEEPSNPTGDVPTIEWPNLACTPSSCSGRSM